MRVGITIAAIFFLLSSTASILAFTAKDDAGPAATNSSSPAVSTTEQPAEAVPATVDENGCVTETESAPGLNRSVVRCKQEATSAPQSSNSPAINPQAPAVPSAPAVPPAPTTPPTEAAPPADVAPQQTTTGDANPACVTEEASGDGWNRTTVRCNRRSETAGSSTSSSSVTTSSSSVSITSSTSNGTP